ncbi:hypothetical protein SAMD00019534_099420 [Acytostelium subglobosum LB1]|uniref:hypothetical protein n=1 Tax=Acytostelium subglobosum LB1 TaxID=1410327 RepID=UPI000644D694|nr:hypothetical protein SAMD00019534_099420 [Acytostelium subglobosum LB1]GAM26767.1 hypothetical protein SAMD00019534_099420 [Acytostelium subglobosum LB1]|eukprot:XP_012750428.1 hypothetical protein SAMD00019534_099420 [Acytostelium subglobosum LB1]
MDKTYHAQCKLIKKRSIPAPPIHTPIKVQVPAPKPTPVKAPARVHVQAAPYHTQPKTTQAKVPTPVQTPSYPKSTPAQPKPVPTYPQTPKAIPSTPAQPPKIQDYVNCINSSFRDIVNFFLECQPERLPYLAHRMEVEKKRYFSNQQYKEYTLPLMFEELKAQVVSQFQEKGALVKEETGELTFQSKELASSSLEMDMHSVSDRVRQRQKSVMLPFKINLTSMLQELIWQDLVLVTLTDTSTNQTLHVMAYVESASRIKHVPTSQSVVVEIRDTTSRCKQVVQWLYNPRTYTSTKYPIKLRVCKVSNFITFQRELFAVNSLSSCKMAIQVLIPRPVTPDKWSQRYPVSQSMATVLSRTLNQSQLDAVAKCMAPTGFTLIQGPPGTGKTKTILALLSVFLNAVPSIKIMVCAPSNTAVDEIAIRIQNKGLFNESGTPIVDRLAFEQLHPNLDTTSHPMVVRLGQLKAVRRELHPMCLEYYPTFKEKKQVLKEASIVLGTLSSAGSNMLIHHRFDIIIVDEATQSVEPSGLIPLQLGASKMILVGDPKQLPPTVFSRVCTRNGYDCSLFERLSLDHPTHLLTVQYRMHPTISEFPSRAFYNGQVVDSSTVREFKQPFYNNTRSYGPLNFYDIAESCEESGPKSFQNSQEVTMVFLLIKKLVQDYPSVKKMSIGIITPYKLQNKRLQEVMQKEFNVRGMDITNKTVDGFQGGEKDIIILSTVRQSKMGFLTDRRRLNVSITRARYALYIIGNGKLLEQDELWGSYIRYIRKCTQANNVITLTDMKTMAFTVKHHDMNNPDGLVTPNERILADLKRQMYEEQDRAILGDYDDEEDFERDNNGDDIDGVPFANEETDVQQEQPGLFTWMLSKLSLINPNADYNQVLTMTYDFLEEIKSTMANEMDVSYKRQQIKEIKTTIKTNIRRLAGMRPDPSMMYLPSGTNLHAMSSLLEQIYESVRCSDEDHMNKQQAFNMLDRVLTAKFPDCNVQAYGSFVNGIELTGSDIDVCMTVQTTFTLEQLMEKVALALLDAGYHVDALITTARVPIVRFHLDNVNFDLCFNNHYAVRNSTLIKSYTKVDSRVQPLLVLIKHWASRKNINNTQTHTLSSYAHANMAIHYLQTCEPPVVPNLQDSQRQVIGNNNNNRKTLAELFYGFFRYYSTMDFRNNLISIRYGQLVAFTDVPHYLDKAFRARDKPICIEDPYDTVHNPGGSVTKDTFSSILCEFRFVEHQLRTQASFNINHLFSKNDLQLELYD